MARLSVLPRMAIFFLAMVFCTLIQSSFVLAKSANVDNKGAGSGVEVNASFSPSTIVVGDSSFFTWSSSGNVFFCSITGVPGLSGRQASAGSIVVTPTSNLRANVSCLGSSNGQREVGSDSATLTVLDSAPAPTVNASFSPNSVFIGQSSTLSWSSINANSCSANNGVGVSGTSGSVVVTPNATLTVTVTCIGDGGSTSQSAAITVVTSVPPSVFAFFSPSFVASGDFSTLFWSSINANFCNFGGTAGALFLGPFFFSSIETVVCFGPGGTGISTAFVSVFFSPEEKPNFSDIDRTVRDELGIAIDVNVDSRELDLNDDGLNDQLIYIPVEQRLLIRLASSDGNMRLIKVVNNIESFDQLQQVMLQEDVEGNLTVEVIVKQ